MKSPTPEAQYTEGVFQIQSPFCDVYFSNNISIPQVRVNKRETELYSTSETSYHVLSMSPTMAVENVQIWIVQLTEKCISETFPLHLHDLIIRPHVKQPP